VEETPTRADEATRVAPRRRALECQRAEERRYEHETEQPDKGPKGPYEVTSDVAVEADVNESPQPSVVLGRELLKPVVQIIREAKIVS
jgi:hypothetical protein